MKYYVVAESKGAAIAKFEMGHYHDDLEYAQNSRDYENKYGYRSEFDHFIYEIKAKKI